MCRTTELDGFYTRDRERLKIGAFYVRLLGLGEPSKALPESLTLLFPPRIDEAGLSIGGSKVPPESRAFVSLHRVDEEAVFGSRERVLATDGLRFEVFLREEKVLEGMFRRREEDEEWRMEVRSGVEDGRDADVAAVEVCVGLDGHVALSERVEIAAKKKKKKKKKRIVGNRLEVIPEEEVGVSDGVCCCDGGYGEVIPEGREEEVGESGGLCCCDGGYGEGSDGWGYEGEGCGPDCRDLEGVKWAVDVGIWVMCLGLGYLVSKASAKSLRRGLRARSWVL